MSFLVFMVLGRIDICKDEWLYWIDIVDLWEREGETNLYLTLILL